jgi:hypothetical protein
MTMEMIPQGHTLWAVVVEHPKGAEPVDRSTVSTGLVIGWDHRQTGVDRPKVFVPVIQWCEGPGAAMHGWAMTASREWNEVYATGIGTTRQHAEKNALDMAERLRKARSK